MKKKVMLIFSFLVMSVGMIFAQTTPIVGTVVDEIGEPVIGASVVVKGTTTGVATDLDGKFSINMPAGKNTLVFHLVGMVDVEAKAVSGMKIVMTNDAVMMEEVMVVAYGTTDKKSFTGSASVVNADKITKRTVANISKAIEGVVTGVTVSSGSGQPGSGATIKIRGVGSINASNDPLYVVDGIPFSGLISSINPSDIESMTVLKDASAGALYGARGANGVIIITTKSGKAGDTQVTFKSNWGWASRAIPRYETVGEKGYLETVFQQYKNEQLEKGLDIRQAGLKAIDEMQYGAGKVLGRDGEYNPYNMPFDQLIDPITGKVNPTASLLYSDDWLDEATASSPLRQEYMLDVAGGNAKNRYLFSFGYLNEKGLLKTTEFERFTGRIKVDSDVKKWLTLGLGANYAMTTSNYSNTSGSASSNVFYAAQLMAPIYPVYMRNTDGSYLLDDNGDKLYDFSLFRAGGGQPDFNNIATLHEDKYATKSDIIGVRGNATLGNLDSGPLQGLSLQINIGADLNSQNQSVHYNPNFGNSKGVKGTTTKYNARNFEFTFSQLLNWKRQFKKHNVDVLVGHEFYSLTYDYLRGARTGYPFAGLTELGPATNTTDLTSYKDTYKIESILSRFNYNYDSRYYFSASLRRDASSVFEKDNRWGSFWSVAGNWRASEEAFIKDLKFNWLDNLALRTSYGLQGNDYILDGSSRNYYGWQAFYDLEGSANANASGAVVSQLENKDVTWEKNHNLNIGLDLQIFNRFSAGIEYYNKKTTDLLLYKPMPVSSGFDGFYENIGSMRNQGWEITLSGDVVKTKDFNWNLTLMGNTINNKILSLSEETPEIIEGPRIKKVGEPINSFYVAKSAGVDPLTGNPLFHVWDIDKDGNKVNERISDNAEAAGRSKEVAGSYFPDLFGSINNQFRYKDFDLAILCTYSIGGKMIDSGYNGLMTSSYMGQTKHKNILRAWKQPGDITDVPKVDFRRTHVYTDADLLDASYFSIKNIVLGYSVPPAFLTKFGLKSVRFNVTADNVVLFTHLKGMNPQYNTTGTNSLAYTPARTISFGLDVKF